MPHTERTCDNPDGTENNVSALCGGDSPADSFSCVDSMTDLASDRFQTDTTDFASVAVSPGYICMCNRGYFGFAIPNIRHEDRTRYTSKTNAGVAWGISCSSEF